MITETAAAVEIQQPDLKAALDKVAKFATRSSTLPVLYTILMEARPGTLVLTTTNLEQALRLTLATKGEGAFRVAVPCKRLQEVVARCDGRLSLTLEEKRVETPNGQYVVERTLVVDKASGQVRIKQCLDAEEYPNITYNWQPGTGKDMLFTMASHHFAHEIKRVGRYAAKDEVRPAFSAVVFEITNDGCRFVTTDSYRLGWSSFTPDDRRGEATILVPANGLKMLLTILPKRPEILVVEVAPNSAMLAISWENTLFLTRTIEATFPDYRRIAHKTPPTRTIVLQASELLAAMEAFGKEIFKDDSNHITLFGVDAERQRLTAHVESEDCDQTEWVAMEMDPAEGSTDHAIKLNAEYVKDMCLAYSGPLVLRLWTPQEPAEFRSLYPDQDGHEVIIMPLHTLRR